MTGVYAIIHQPSGRAYIGSSVDIVRRWKSHVAGLGRATSYHAKRLLDLWLQDGPTAFTFVVLEQCPREMLVEREQEWLDCFDALLNTSRYAENPMRDPEVLEKQRAAVSAAMRGRTFGPRDPAIGQRIAAALRGKPHTEERKRNISRARLGKPVSEKMQQHLTRLHVQLRENQERRNALVERMREPVAREHWLANHWARSPEAETIGRRISASKRKVTSATLQPSTGEPNV